MEVELGDGEEDEGVEEEGVGEDDDEGVGEDEDSEVDDEEEEEEEEYDEDDDGGAVDEYEELEEEDDEITGSSQGSVDCLEAVQFSSQHLKTEKKNHLQVLRNIEIQSSRPTTVLIRLPRTRRATSLHRSRRRPIAQHDTTVTFASELSSGKRITLGAALGKTSRSSHILGIQEVPLRIDERATAGSFGVAAEG